MSDTKRTGGMWRLMAPCVVAALLTACAGGPWSPSSPAPARHVNLSGYSPAFRQGYADGCDSVQSRRRDEQRYRGETDYMMGWNDGYSACKRR